MAVNDTKDFFYLTPDDTVYAGDSPPSGSTVLVGPGGTISDDLAEKHGLTGKLGDDPAVRRDGAGNPVVVRGGRAIAASVLPAGDPDREAALGAAAEDDEARAKADAKARKRSDDEAEAADVATAREKVAAADAKGKAAEGKAVHREAPGVEDKAVKGPGSAHKATPRGK